MWFLLLSTSTYEENKHTNREMEHFQVRNWLGFHLPKNGDEVVATNQARFRAVSHAIHEQVLTRGSNGTTQKLKKKTETNAVYRDVGDLRQNKTTDIERNSESQVSYLLKRQSQNASLREDRKSGMTSNFKNPTKARAYQATKTGTPKVSLQTPVSENPKILLIIAVVSAPGRSQRRNAIRQTWMSKCRTNKRIVCKFFTDKYVRPNTLKQLERENELNKDMEFLPLSEGLWFGMRLLLVLKWATRNYDFFYLLRMDDDYYLCVERLLEELSPLPMSKFVRGYMHCKRKATRVDDGWMLLSNALIQSFLSREDLLLCHPFGDQQVAIWLNDEKNVEIFHDFRIHHHPPAKVVHSFQRNPFICKEYIAVHGTYPTQMLLFWDASLKLRDPPMPSEVLLMPSYRYCPYDRTFDWRFIAAAGEWYRLPPKPCRENPTWDLPTSPFLGREKKY